MISLDSSSAMKSRYKPFLSCLTEEDVAASGVQNLHPWCRFSITSVCD
jgi:hypothetical protein